MNIFKSVKEVVSVRDAASFYGINVNRRGMCLCPFHNDRKPSMKVDKRFHCFGCREDGDVIDFVGKLFSLTPFEAAKKVAEDFHVSVTPCSRPEHDNRHDKPGQEDITEWLKTLENGSEVEKHELLSRLF